MTYAIDERIMAMKNERETLGEICRSALARAFNGRKVLDTSPNPRVLYWLKDHIEVEVRRLRAGIEATLETTRIGRRPSYTIELPSPCEDFNIEDAPGFEKILDFCAQEDISVRVMPMLVGAGTRGFLEPGVGIKREPYYAVGFCLTFDPSRKFAGLERKENKMLTDLPIDPAP